MVTVPVGKEQRVGRLRRGAEAGARVEEKRGIPGLDPPGVGVEGVPRLGRGMGAERRAPALGKRVGRHPAPGSASAGPRSSSETCTGAGAGTSSITWVSR